MGTIAFFNEDIEFTLPAKRCTAAWLKQIVEREGKQVEALNYVFCSDDYLLDVNRQYLDHDYYTDIITFNQSEDSAALEGDIYISIDRVRDNAESLGVTFEEELRRVLCHGLLHLCGYDDHTDADRAAMREREDFYLFL
ncbi:MAG: rRNA maturation RNase YbeY [Cytophagales bacterium]|jgi:rRNA maturation RNase YbeY|nr:rRNA maturation RNase YbeY [Cytophagales bacterium]